jgi:WD40 repeat protein
MDVPVGEWVITSLQMNHDQSVAYVANNHGNLFGFDMKTQKVAHKFKGHQGGIRQIAVHPEDDDLIVSAGLDRWLRVFSMSTRQCLGRVYMKQMMSGVQWDVRSPASEEAAAEAEKKGKGKKKKKKARVAEDVDEEEVPKKKKKLRKSDGEKVAKKKKKVRRDDDDEF